ncbi:MAG: traM [Mucilaginibacter sp.]|nr:traM [Mucilaginibacter sp.]
METTKRTPQFYRTRKALLVLPLFILPLVTLGFWKLHQAPLSGRAAQTPGLNASLPGAKFDKHEKAGNKMSFYDQAKQDSARVRSNDNNPLVKQFGFKQPDKTINTTTPVATNYTDPNVTRINQKLADINKQISQPITAPVTTPPIVKQEDNKQLTEQVSRLEGLMKNINTTQEADPQMQQLSQMLEKIQQIQHPEMVKAPIKTETTENAFKAIPAIIDGNQKVLQGGAVRLKLNDSLTIKGQLIPKGTPIFGTANITNQRLLLEIKNIRLGEAIIPVNLTVYSEDSMPGIPAPEAELAGAAGNGADNAVSSMQFLSMDQNLATQAAAGGIQAAKGLFSKKVRRIKVHLKNGYPVLLRNNSLRP